MPEDQYFTQFSIFIHRDAWIWPTKLKIAANNWNTMHQNSINLKVDNPNRYDMDERTAVLVMELDDCNNPLPIWTIPII
jgi:hypothetical protein